MQNTPYFSIMIPTRNRSHIVHYAIESVLKQSYRDFEIVLVDNDLSDMTSQVVQQYQSDERFKYFRTGNLSMPDNWEFGYRQSRGAHFLCIEDKMFLKKDALRKLHDTFENHDVDFLVWQLDYYDDESNELSLQNSGRRKLQWISSRDTLRLMENCNIRRYMPVAPRGFNFCASQEKIEQAINKTVEKRFFIPVSPDFTSGFQLLMNYQQYGMLPHAISGHSFSSCSNGTSVILKKKEGINFMQEVGADAQKMRVPIKTLGCWNSVINDFLKIASLHGREGEFRLNLLNYFVVNRQEFAFAQSKGVDMSAEMAAVDDALNDIEDEKLKKLIARTIHAMPCPETPTFGTMEKNESSRAKIKGLSFQKLLWETTRPLRQLKNIVTSTSAKRPYANFEAFINDYCGHVAERKNEN